VPASRPRNTSLSTLLGWPFGIALTSWRYMWRTTPVHRWELLGELPADAPPALPPEIVTDGIQAVGDGHGALLRRQYRTQIRGARTSPEELREAIAGDLGAMMPRAFGPFEKTSGDGHRLSTGDEYVVRMPGPWNGPVRVVGTTGTSFRLATLEGHLEAGQIEFRVTPAPGVIVFAIESWARSGNRLADLLYSRLRMAKEVQLNMWTSVIERVVERSGGKMEGGIVVTTRRVDAPRSGGSEPGGLDGMLDRAVNFDPARAAEEDYRGWHVDDMVARLPGEPSGDPAPGGSWETARRLLIDYQVADPAVVRAGYRPGDELAGRTMVLTVRFGLIRLRVGVRVGEVYDELRTVEGVRARVFGWSYRTLEGHFERGEMHYEVWKWLESGDVEFRLHAFSRPAVSGPLIPRLGFRLVGRQRQLAFYRDVCRRMRRITEAELEMRHMRR